MLQIIRNTLSYKYAFGAGLLLLFCAIIFGISMLIANTIFSYYMFRGFLPFIVLIWSFIITATSSGIWFLIILIDLIKHKSHKPQNTQSKAKLAKDFVVIIYTLYSLFVVYVVAQDFIIKMSRT